jgi:hypothetical protein
MSRTWILQANPAHYDIDGALGVLDQIWWRTPRYTSEIQVGDAAVVWRSGPDAGIVGIARVIAAPQVQSMDPAEATFVRSDEEEPAEATRALVRLRPVPFVAKDQVKAIPQLSEHQIIVGPMGTVFPLTESAWEALRPLLPPPPDAPAVFVEVLPSPFAWPQRAKGVLPMPGGYNGYLKSLAKVCALVEEERPTPGELAARLEALLDVKPTAARLRESFLRKVGIVTVQGGVARLGPWTEKWRRMGDDRIVVALLHSRCQYIGELLEAALEPRTNEELLAVGNDIYGMGWDTQTQVVNRRGWLQSAGMLAKTDDGKVTTTPKGQVLLGELVLYRPGVVPPMAPVVPPAEPPAELVSTPLSAGLERLVEMLKTSATESASPEKFEQAVRDAFAFLGFSAAWIGGSGKTDVLLDANLGKDESYRVTVDCKTSASGSVGDQQIDWVTLADHKAKHDAQFVAIVAPSPSGARLFERAHNQQVTVFSADELIGICRQHAKTPMGLDDYRTLFGVGGAVDTNALDEKAEEVTRVTVLAAAVCEAMRQHSAAFGRLSARDLFLVLAGDPAAEGTTEAELQSLLDTLSTSLFGILEGSPAAGYRLTMAPDVAQLRLEVVARQLGHDQT